MPPMHSVTANLCMQLQKVPKAALLDLLDVLKGENAVMNNDNTKADIAAEIVHSLS